jgi:hypothetical protein
MTTTDIQFTRYINAVAVALGIIGGGLAPPAPAGAQTAQQFRWCNGDDHATPDMMIGGCTALIGSGKYSGRNLAVAFTNRGGAYDDKRDEDRAIADHDQAIKIDPKLHLAFNNRANAYGRKGDIDRAIADYDQAIRIDPKFFEAYNNRGTTYRAGTIMTGRSPTMTRRSGSIQNSPTPTTSAGLRMTVKATASGRWPTTPARSASIRNTRSPTTIEASYITAGASTRPPSRISARPSEPIRATPMPTGIGPTPISSKATTTAPYWISWRRSP